MLDNKEFGFHCPNCDKQDFDKPVPDSQDEVADFLGAKCQSCGHQINTDDLNEFCHAINEYIDALMNDETFH